MGIMVISLVLSGTAAGAALFAGHSLLTALLIYIGVGIIGTFATTGLILIGSAQWPQNSDLKQSKAPI